MKVTNVTSRPGKSGSDLPIRILEKTLEFQIDIRNSGQTINIVSHKFEVFERRVLGLTSKVNRDNDELPKKMSFLTSGGNLRRRALVRRLGKIKSWNETTENRRLPKLEVRYLESRAW